MDKSIDIATSNAVPPVGVPRYGYTFGGHKFLKTTELVGEAPETRLYLGGAEFVEGQPESYYHGEGRVALTGDKPAFQYKLTDHLGNTMVLFEDKDDDKIITTESMSTDPAMVEVLQRNFYYAFGLPMQGPWNHTPADPDMPYLYNGKELEGELGLGWYAYGFRYYDASIGRFVGVDPLAGEMPDWSPYGYAYSNPISFIDFMGLSPEDTYGIDGDGRITKLDDKKYYDENGNEVDMLLKGSTLSKYNKGKGIKGKGHIQVESGALANLESDGLNDDSQVFSISSGKAAEDLYDFIAWSTNNEVGKYDVSTGGGENKSIFHTTFDWNKIEASTIYLQGLKEDDPGLQLNSMIHSHGNNPDPNSNKVGSPGPSGAKPGDMHGDVPQARYLNNRVFNDQAKPPTYFIWRYGLRTQYNENGKIEKID